MQGTYEPSIRRVVEREKRGGGTRPISIRSIVHRIVTTAVYEALYPVIEPVFVAHSYGFLHGRSAWDMLLAIRRDVHRFGKSLVINDMAKAFDNVNPNLAMEDINRHVTDKCLRALIERILRGNPLDIREQAEIGTDQGSSLSPLILNILLHYRLDVPLMGTSDPVVHRYADNLATVAATALQGQERMQQVEGLLTKIGMQLKYPIEAVELTATSTVKPPELLGYQLKLDQAEKLIFGLADTARESLAEALQEAHETENPADHARAAVIGWCGACGPALEVERYDSIIGTVLSMTAEYGFRGIATEDCRRALQSSFGRWQAKASQQKV